VKVVTIRCDRCGETIDVGRALVAIVAGPTPPTWPTDPETGRPACPDALTGWLRDTVTPGNLPAARCKGAANE
jgi:hypothetical protein